LQAHELVFGPVDVHAAFTAHPPLPVAHELIAAHVVPLPK
jgi:hypothetical protein